jgi:hypothetical protein
MQKYKERASFNLLEEIVSKGCSDLAIAEL